MQAQWVQLLYKAAHVLQRTARALLVHAIQSLHQPPMRYVLFFFFFASLLSLFLDWSTHPFCVLLFVLSSTTCSLESTQPNKSASERARVCFLSLSLSFRCCLL